MTIVYLIYVKSPKGPSPQKVETIPINSQGRSLPVLAKHQLTQDEWPLPLKLLQLLYPAPKVTES
jgi:hypothetical protein